MNGRCFRSSPHSRCSSYGNTDCKNCVTIGLRSTHKRNYGRRRGTRRQPSGKKAGPARNEKIHVYTQLVRKDGCAGNEEREREKRERRGHGEFCFVRRSADDGYGWWQPQKKKKGRKKARTSFQARNPTPWCLSCAIGPTCDTTQRIFRRPTTGNATPRTSCGENNYSSVQTLRGFPVEPEPASPSRKPGASSELKSLPVCSGEIGHFFVRRLTVSVSAVV